MHILLFFLSHHLNDNDDVPQYTASAPYKNAIFAFSYEPAGANNSTSFIFYLPSVLFIQYIIYFFSSYVNLFSILLYFSGNLWYNIHIIFLRKDDTL